MPLRSNYQLDIFGNPVNPATNDSQTDGNQKVQLVDEFGNVSHSTQDLHGDWHTGVHIIQHNIVAPYNSSNINIAPGEENAFIGIATPTSGANCIIVKFFSDQNAEIYIEQSVDGGINWNIHDKSIFTNFINNYSTPVAVVGTHFRVKVVNTGPVSTTVFSLVSQLQPIGMVLPRSLCGKTGCLKTASNVSFDLYGFTAEFTPTGEQKMAKVTPIVGEPFEGTEIDNKFWEYEVLNGGTADIADGDLNLSTNTSLNGSVKLWSVNRALSIPGQSMRYRGVIGYNNNNSITNIRKIGIAWGETMPNYTDGALFILEGSDFKLSYIRGGVVTEITEFNGDLGTNWSPNIDSYECEIYYTQNSLKFTINGETLHTVTELLDHWSNTLQHHIFFENTNYGDISDNNEIYIHDAGIVRFGDFLPRTISDWQNGSIAEKVLKIGVGVIKSLVITGVLNNAIVNLYDNTSASGDIIFSTGNMGAQATPISIDLVGIQFNKGLTLSIPGASANVLTIYN